MKNISKTTVHVDEVGDKIEKWLDEEGFSVWKFADRGSLFSYKATREDYHPLLIFQPQNKTDSILVISDIKLAIEDQKQFLAIPEEERKFMLFDFKMALLATECHWQFIPSSESWKTIRISRIIFYDGLSKNRFFENVDAVARAASLVLLTFQLKFGITPYIS